MSARRPLLATGLLLMAGAASASGDPLHQCLSALDVRIANIGQPRAAEVAADLDGLKDEASRLRRRIPEYDETRSAVEEERARLDRLVRERDRLLRQIEVDQQAVNNELHDLSERIRVHNAEADQVQAAVDAAQTPAAQASANSRVPPINSRKAMLDRELELLRQRHDEIDVRRNDIANDIVGHGRRLEALERNSGWADMEFSGLMQQCSSLSMRALALLQVRNRPARGQPHQSPDEMARRVLKDLGENFIQNAAENRLFAIAEGAAAVTPHPLARPAVKVAKVGWTAAEVLRDGAGAGLDARDLEILNHLYLLGDYAETMRDLIKAEGSAAIGTPEYQAMAQERERMENLLPRSNSQMFFHSLRSTSALAGTLGAFLAKYSGEVASGFGAKITNHLNNMDRQVLGRGVTYARETLRALAGGSAETGVNEFSRAAALSARRQKYGPVDAEMRQGPVTEMRQGPVTEMRQGPVTEMRQGPETEMRQGPVTEMWPAPSRAQ